MSNNVSIIVPTYKSGSFIGLSVTEIDKYARPLFTNYEIILVDDGSNDPAIASVANELYKKNIPVRLIKLQRNYGQFWATNVGLLVAKNDTLITIDDDLKFSPENFEQMVKTRNNHTYFLVYGVLKGDVFKHGGRYIVNFFFGKRMASSLRYFSKSLIDNIETIDLQLDAHLEKIKYTQDFHYGYFFIKPPEKHIRQLSRTTFITRALIIFNYMPIYPRNLSLPALGLFTALAGVFLYYHLLIAFAVSTMCALYFVAMRINYLFAPAAIKTNTILWDEINLAD